MTLPRYGEWGSPYLGHGLIVDSDEIAGRRVDLEGLVEGEGRLEEGVR